MEQGKLVGAKPPLKPSHVRSIRTKLQIEGKKRDLARFHLAIDSYLRGCDVVAVRVDDVVPSGYSMDRATIRQKKTGRPNGELAAADWRTRLDSGVSRRSSFLLRDVGAKENLPCWFPHITIARQCHDKLAYWCLRYWREGISKFGGR